MTADLFHISSPTTFNRICLETFEFQYEHIAVYRKYCDLIQKSPAHVNSYLEIPFLPIEFFKTHELIAQGKTQEVIFSSSGTTGSTTSKHLVASKKLYEESFFRAFKQFYGAVEDRVILALLPSYLEREGSSLIYMVDALIKESKRKESGFFFYNHQELYYTLSSLKQAGEKPILFGVTFGLLDFIEQHPIAYPDLTVIETGGMKGRRKEIIREEVHEILSTGFQVQKIHSEYGMTELLSQGYSKGDGIFYAPEWMKILIRDPNDPFTLLESGKSGAINVIDLANIYSCSFIATQDLGIQYPDTSFKVLGRFDNSDIRGCNLLVQ